MRARTKTEQGILDRVQSVNDRGSLAGLSVAPDEPQYSLPAFRFVKRLADAGLIVWIEWGPVLGAGWLLAGRDPKMPTQPIDPA